LINSEWQNQKQYQYPCDISQKLTEDVQTSEEEMKTRPYRELVAGFIYLANATRTDIAYIANVLSRFYSGSRKKHWIAAKRVV
jgi:protein associated with RNAse G/E